MERGNWIVLFVAATWTTTLAGVHAESASEILDTAGVPGGLVVHAGCGDGTLTAAIGANDGYLVQGLNMDSAGVALIRQRNRAQGKEGQFSVIQWDGKHLPYATGIVNLILIDVGNVPLLNAEIGRVLAP